MGQLLIKVHARFVGARIHAAKSGWGMAEYLSYPLMMFLATPSFLMWLGPAQYGQWMLLLTFNGLGGLAGLGMGSAAIRDVSAARGRQDALGAIAAVRACLSVTILSSAAIGMLLLLFGALASGDFLARMGHPALVRTIIAVAALLILVEQLDTVFAGTLRGLERFDISAKVEALTKGGLVLAALIAAWTTRDVRWVFVATVVMTLVRLAIKAGVASVLLRAVPWPSWDRPRMFAVFAFGKWTWAQAFGAALFSTADRFLVGALLGAEALARYSICVQLAQQVQTIPAAGAQFLFPAVSRLRESGEEYRGLAIKASLAVAAFSAALSLPLALLAGPILNAWVGAAIAATSANVLALLTLAFTMLAANVGPFYVLLGSGRERFVALLNIAGGAIALGLLWFAINQVGLMGAAIGRICYAAVTSLSIIAFVNHLGAGLAPTSNPKKRGLV